MMNFLSQTHLLADDASTTSALPMIIMIILLLGVMYFFMIRPQRKQEKETNAMRNGLQVGDEITTIGGIIGKIISIKGETCMIETGRDRTRIRILKSAVRCVDVPASIANGPIPVDTEAKKAQTSEELSIEGDKTADTASENDSKKKKKKK